jgi:hypothetical protein
MAKPDEFCCDCTYGCSIINQMWSAFAAVYTGASILRLLAVCSAEGIKMLQDDGLTDVDPLGDLNTELERRLGKIVKDKYGTDFYILHRYPMAVSTRDLDQIMCFTLTLPGYLGCRAGIQDRHRFLHAVPLPHGGEGHVYECVIFTFFAASTARAERSAAAFLAASAVLSQRRQTCVCQTRFDVKPGASRALIAF